MFGKEIQEKTVNSPKQTGLSFTHRKDGGMKEKWGLALEEENLCLVHLNFCPEICTF